MVNKPEEKFMKRALELARHGSLVEKSGGAFGAVVVKEGKIIGEGYNQVIKHNDPTWHGEMHAIREACKKLGSPHLDKCALYTTGECCPMCLAASYWAHIETIFYGATAEDALIYGGFADSDIEGEIRKKPKERRIPAIQYMRLEVVEIWKEYQAMPDKVHY